MRYYYVGRTRTRRNEPGDPKVLRTTSPGLRETRPCCKATWCASLAGSFACLRATKITLLDNSGKEFDVRLTSFGETTVEGEVLSVHQGPVEPPVKVTLYQGVLKGEKFHWVLQKGTELGISAFIPLVCRRSVSRPKESWAASRYPRWLKIVTEAAEQSGRCVLPPILPPMAFQDACNGVKGSTATSIIPWERERTVGLRTVLGRLGSDGHPCVNIFIGPEGGFEDDEVSYAPLLWGYPG